MKAAYACQWRLWCRYRYRDVDIPTSNSRTSYQGAGEVEGHLRMGEQRVHLTGQKADGVLARAARVSVLVG